MNPQDLEEAEQMIHSDSDTLAGEPVFKGSRIPVYGLIAMMDGGATYDELITGHPILDHRKLYLARLWTQAHPRQGHWLTSCAIQFGSNGEACARA